MDFNPFYWLDANILPKKIVDAKLLKSRRCTFCGIDCERSLLHYHNVLSRTIRSPLTFYLAVFIYISTKYCSSNSSSSTSRRGTAKSHLIAIWEMQTEPDECLVLIRNHHTNTSPVYYSKERKTQHAVLYVLHVYSCVRFFPFTFPRLY